MKNNGFGKISRVCLLSMACWLGTLLGPVSASTVSDSLRGELVSYNNKELQSFDDGKLADIKLFAFYYSAHWCPPCRAFTPELVQFYNRVKKNHPEFELIFLSHDKSRDAMIEYMRVMKMPWPATEFGKGAGIRPYSHRGIPCLVVVDENGKVLADSYEGENYLGPKKAMDELGKLLARNKAKQNGPSDFDTLFKKKPAQQ